MLSRKSKSLTQSSISSVSYRAQAPRQDRRLALGRMLSRASQGSRSDLVALLLGAVLGLGLLGFSRISVIDDAYISFRYAHNLAEGHGFVFNSGEYVEG